MEIMGKMNSKLSIDKSMMKELKCSKHCDLDIIYFNTNIESKYFLACELCVIEEEILSDQLLPLCVLKDSTHLNQEQFISSIKKHFNQYKIYESLKEIDFEERKYSSKITFKDLRVKVNNLIDQMEEVADKQLHIFELFLNRLKKQNENFYKKIIQVIDEFSSNNEGINNQYQQLLIKYDLESEQMLDLIDRINKFNQNCYFDINKQKLDKFLTEFNNQIESQFNELSQNEIATINLVFDDIKFRGIQQEQLLLQGLIKDNQMQENVIEINCSKCNTQINKFNKQDHSIQLQQENLQKIQFQFREKNSNKQKQKFELDLYQCSNKYLKELIGNQYEIKPDWVDGIIDNQIITSVFTKKQFDNIFYQTYQQLHCSDQEKQENKRLYKIQVKHVEKLINLDQQIDYKDLQKTDRDYILKTIPETITQKQLMISVYRDLRFHFQQYQQNNKNIEYAIELNLNQNITDDQAILEISQFDTIFSLYTSSGQQIQLIEEDIIIDQSQMNEPIQTLELLIVDNYLNRFKFYQSESNIIKEIKGNQQPSNENFFIEYFMKNFKDILILKHKNEMKCFCSKCKKVEDCKIVEYYENSIQDYLVINCKLIEKQFSNNSFQKLNLNSNEIDKIQIFEDKKYNLVCCLAKDHLTKYNFIVRDSEQKEWYSYQNALKMEINNQEVSKLIPQYLYYKLIK